MNQKEGKKRFTVSLPMQTYKDLEDMAEANDDSVDKTARILIQNAIKERKRKRKNAKEDSSSDNA